MHIISILDRLIIRRSPPRLAIVKSMSGDFLVLVLQEFEPLERHRPKQTSERQLGHPGPSTTDRDLSFSRRIMHECVMKGLPPFHIMPGMTAFLLPIFSFPNLSTYHCLPPRALGSMVATSLMKNVLAGAQAIPPTIQNPPHSTHSHR